MPGVSNPLRILMVAPRYRYPCYPQGGLAIHLYNVGRRLVGAGVHLTMLVADSTGQLPTYEEVEGIQIRRVRAWPDHKDFYFAPGIYSVITHGQWDIVHCQAYRSLVTPLAMLAALRANIPYVLTLHSSGDLSHFRKAVRGLHWMMLRPLLARASKVIGVSAFEANAVQHRLQLAAEQFVVISNGADHLLEFAGGATNAAVHEAPLILSVGRLERYKGHQRVIAALPEVLEHVPDARLRIAGTGPYEPALWKLAKGLGLSECVEIKAVPQGDGSAMASLIARSDLVTLLSEYESQGIAVLEALALKRPVLVASTSALQEFVDRGLARAVSINSKPEEVAKAIIDQLSQPLIPGHVTLPTWDACVAGLLSLYREVLRVSSHSDAVTVLSAR